MHLLIVTPIFPPQIGGPASYVNGLLERLQGQHKVKVVTFAESKMSDADRVYRVLASGNMIARQARLLLQLFKLAQKNQVFYAQGTIVVGVASLIISKLKKIPLAIKFVGDEVWEPLAEAGKTKETLEVFYAHKQYVNTKLWLHRLVLRHASRLVVPSKYLKDFLVSVHGINPLKITVISNAVGIPTSFKAPQIKDPHKLVFVGRLVPWKHVDLIIEAVLLARSNKPWTLTIIGDGAVRMALVTQVKRLNAETWITFKGKLSKIETLVEIASASRLVLYSSYEGQPHTLIEAQLLQTPVIASNIVPHVELLGKQNLVPLYNPNALAQAINTPVTHNAITLAASSFDWTKHTKKLESVLNAML